MVVCFILVAEQRYENIFLFAVFMVVSHFLLGPICACFTIDHGICKTKVTSINLVKKIYRFIILFLPFDLHLTIVQATIVKTTIVQATILFKEVLDGRVYRLALAKA
jgi:hypothetical protein